MCRGAPESDRTLHPVSHQRKAPLFTRLGFAARRPRLGLWAYDSVEAAVRALTLGQTGGVTAAATRTVSRSALVRTLPGFRRSRHVRTSAAWSS